MPAARAQALTGDAVIVCPRPTGASGLLTTATTSCREDASARRLGNAGSGVPAKTNRMPYRPAVVIGYVGMTGCLGIIEGLGIIEATRRSRAGWP